MAHSFSVVRENVRLEHVFTELYVLRRFNRLDQPRIAVRLARVPVIQPIVELFQEGIKERNVSHLIPCQLLKAFCVVKGQARPIEQFAMLFRMQKIGKTLDDLADVG